MKLSGRVSVIVVGFLAGYFCLTLMASPLPYASTDAHWLVIAAWVSVFACLIIGAFRQRISSHRLVQLAVLTAFVLIIHFKVEAVAALSEAPDWPVLARHFYPLLILPLLLLLQQTATEKSLWVIALPDLQDARVEVERIATAEGASVSEGESLVFFRIDNELTSLTSPCNGVVDHIPIHCGERLRKGDTVIHIQARPEKQALALSGRVCSLDKPRDKKERNDDPCLGSYRAKRKTGAL